MNLTRNTLSIGAEKPFRFLHMSDTHCVLADEKDDQRKRDLAVNRRNWYAGAPEVSREIEAYAQKNHLMIAHTGDYIDFVSHANLERLKRFTDENDVFLTAGNHEFSLYVGEAVENAEYRNKSLATVQACVKNDIRFASRKINGVNLVAIDNGYYLFDEAQFEGLKKEVACGLPIILFMHTPLYDKELYQIMAEKNLLGSAAYMVAVPDELMTYYSKSRYEQQHADDLTREMTEYIKAQPLIKAIFCGHIHDFISETKLTDHITQYISNFENVRLVEVE